jgi:hypothetical protein
MPQAAKLQLNCPLCGSRGVVYTCTPNCCFNHVCGDCGATFEPVSRALGERRNGVEPPDPLPDASDPTVECAACGSTAVYSLETEIICAACQSKLAIEYTEVAPA